MIQYPIAHPNYGMLQRPNAYSNNLVKNNEQNSKGMQPRWCPLGLSALKQGDYSGCESKDQWSNL
jgi:hypothetical protein